LNRVKNIISTADVAVGQCAAHLAEQVMPFDEPSDISPDVEQRAFTLGPGQHGSRIDRALAVLVPEFSRNYLRQLVEAELVTLNGKLVRKASQLVKAGDSGVIELRATPQSQAFTPEVMPLDIVFEDLHLRVINKPAGLVVHPAPGNWSGTLLNGLLADDPAASLLPRAGIVHRLDKDTSGLMVVARTRAMMDALVKLIAQRDMSRQYLAMAHRPWTGVSERTVEAALGRDPRNRLRMAVVDLDRTSGKSAMTSFKLLRNSEQACLVHCSLHTGRTHQIRVHMSSIGHPLIADALYGGAPGAGLARQALHAYRLAFDHPLTAQPLTFHAALPQDMASGLQQWGLDYNVATVA
jgi:23S rRNA pseudouridine1911/1915/1917 synthase